jgi:nucleoside-diphosphate-sugar epimerase
MRVFITGTDGYIGVQLGAHLLEHGHDVIGLDTGFYREGWLYNGGIRRLPKCLVKDIRQITKDDLQGVDAVVHLAELSNDPLGQFDPEITYRINHQSSVRLAELTKSLKISRFVYTSSCSVYGIGSGELKSEESEPQPQTAYACCKTLVERDVSALASEEFSPTFLRNATAYGASPRMRFDLVLNNLAALAWTMKEIRMTSDGTPWRPLVHVLDICEAIRCVLEAPREPVHKQIFNVGDTKENYRIREIAEIVSSTFPDCKMSLGNSDGDTRSYRVSFDKIKRALPSFRCKRTLASGAQELFELFQRIDLDRSVFEFRPFTRLKQLEYLVKTEQLDRELFWRVP